MSENNVRYQFQNPFSGLTWLLILLILISIYKIYPEHHLGPGVVAPDDPRIALLGNNIPFTTTIGEYTITPLATFHMRARVLHTHSYWFDRESELSPVDFAMGWGEMSNQAILDQLSIGQDSRWFSFSYDHPLPLSNQYLISHSTNMHMIPSNNEIKKKLKSVHENEIIDIDGYLVRVNAKDGYHWTSSLSLLDTGPHACKLVWVQNIIIEK